MVDRWSVMVAHSFMAERVGIADPGAAISGVVQNRVDGVLTGTGH